MKCYVPILMILLAGTAWTLDESETPKDGREGKFFHANKLVGMYSVTTVYSLQTRTVSSAYTCLSTFTSAVCAGRRRRALIKQFDLEDNEKTNDALDASQGNDGVAIEENDREGKKVTVWSTDYSTMEILVTEGISGSTVTVSAYCNMINGFAISQSCFIG